ncbi:MAG: hypothetical protein HRT41_15400 [Campylobacteraceae bacterium]|nr:hypothetical protein [Campylobacteraceae bacterium]
MNGYLKVLQEKAKKINVNIEDCSYDKECITNLIAAKVRANLEHEELSVIKEKAVIIEAIIPTNKEDKIALLDAIEERIKEILKEENERFTSIELQENFIPLDFG